MAGFENDQRAPKKSRTKHIPIIWRPCVVGPSFSNGSSWSSFFYTSHSTNLPLFKCHTIVVLFGS
jgi:hypothetical protein